MPTSAIWYILGSVVFFNRFSADLASFPPSIETIFPLFTINSTGFLNTPSPVAEPSIMILPSPLSSMIDVFTSMSGKVALLP